MTNNNRTRSCPKHTVNGRTLPNMMGKKSEKSLLIAEICMIRGTAAYTTSEMDLILDPVLQEDEVFMLLKSTPDLGLHSVFHQYS